jgi:hypothetical protein
MSKLTTPRLQKATTVWRLRVPKSLVAKIRKLADEQRRSVTKQAELLLEEAVNGTQPLR